MRLLPSLRYAPGVEPRAGLDAAAESFAELLRADCGAAEAGWAVPE